MELADSLTLRKLTLSQTVPIRKVTEYILSHRNRPRDRSRVLEYSLRVAVPTASHFSRDAEQFYELYEGLRSGQLIPTEYSSRIVNEKLLKPFNEEENMDFEGYREATDPLLGYSGTLQEKVEKAKKSFDLAKKYATKLDLRLNVRMF